MPLPNRSPRLRRRRSSPPSRQHLKPCSPPSARATFRCPHLRSAPNALHRSRRLPSARPMQSIRLRRPKSKTQDRRNSSPRSYLSRRHARPEPFPKGRQPPSQHCWRKRMSHAMIPSPPRSQVPIAVRSKPLRRNLSRESLFRHLVPKTALARFLLPRHPSPNRLSWHRSEMNRLRRRGPRSALHQVAPPVLSWLEATLRDRRIVAG